MKFVKDCFFFYNRQMDSINNSFLIRIWIWILVFNANFSYIMATSFSGGGSRSTRREPPTLGKQLVNLITCGCESNAPFFVIYKAVLVHAVLVIGLYEVLDPTT